MANSKGALSSLVKRLTITNHIQIWTHPSPPLSLPLLLGRAAHSSAYDKNPEEHVRPSIVPDHLIEAQSDKYWAPHPQTGVFTPVTDHSSVTAANGAGAESSLALEEKAWFRPTSLEDFEKPHHT